MTTWKQFTVNLEVRLWADHDADLDWEEVAYLLAQRVGNLRLVLHGEDVRVQHAEVDTTQRDPDELQP